MYRPSPCEEKPTRPPDLGCKRTLYPFLFLLRWVLSAYCVVLCVSRAKLTSNQ